MFVYNALREKYETNTFVIVTVGRHGDPLVPIKWL